jgi:hypothetical protein
MSIQKQERIFKQVAAGKTIFTKVDDQWMIVGPAADITCMFQRVTVTKADGTTSEVSTIELYPVKEVRGVQYRVAKFRRVSDASTTQTSTPQRGYRTVSGALGTGRVYHDQPGATHYDDDGSGRYTTQLWDNS